MSNWVQKISQGFEEMGRSIFPQEDNNIDQITSSIRSGLIPNQVYHGTSSEFWTSISQQGLVPRLPQNLGGSVDPRQPAEGIYLTFNQSFAQQAANSQSPLVLGISTEQVLPFLSQFSIEGLMNVANGGQMGSGEIVAEKPIPPSLLNPL